MKHPSIFGYLAEFETPTELVEAAEKVYAEGYRKIDTYSPFPLESASEAIGFHHTRLPLIVLIGGLTGLATAFGMQYWISAISAVIGMFALNGLPMPYHPVFNVQRFVDASKDGFFLVVEATDPKFDAENTESFLKSLSPAGVWEVPY